MNTFNNLSGPLGSPAGVRAAVSRLSVAAKQTVDAGQRLTESGHDSQKAWSGNAQMLFALLAEGVGGLMTGAGEIAAEFSQALYRYSRILEMCQREVQAAGERLQAAAGPIPDSASIASSIQQADSAKSEAEAAARELSAKALELIGSPQSKANTLTAPGDAKAYFVSHAHSVSGSLVPGNRTSSSFDAGAHHIEEQLGSILTALVPGPNKSIAVLPAGTSPAHGATAVVLGPQASAVEGSIILKPGTGTGAGTVLLGPQQPLSTAPGVVVLSPGTVPAPASVAMIDINDPNAAALAQLEAELEAEANAEIAEYAAYLESPEYQANLARSRDGGINESIGDAMSFNAITNSQEWINRYNNAGAESMLGTDLDLSGDVGDV